MSIEQIIENVLVTEGWPEYTDDKTDRGGPTKGGITLAALSLYRGKTATVEDLQDLTKEEATDLYKDAYIYGPSFDKIADETLREQVIDCGVLHGQKRATEWLQEIIGTRIDGKFGCVSQAFVNEGNARDIAVKLAVKRIRFIGALVEKRRDQAKYVEGWLVRATEFLLKTID